MNADTGTVIEKPLNGFSRLALFCGAGAVVLLSYIFFTVSLFLLLLLIGLEFLLLLGLARFGLARVMSGVMGSHIALLTVLVRGFWLKKGVEFQVMLQQPEAPALFELLKTLCQKAQVEMPRAISVEMTANAWVRLKGYRRNAGKTTLGLGYDLLAGLTQWEIEGVLAHEITHAKLVQRGYKNWLTRGLARMGQLAGQLSAHVDRFERAHTSSEPAALLFRITDSLTRVAARLVAACSRQDEFDADLGAAKLCGPGPIRSSLMKLEDLARRSARLPWNERVGRLQTGEGFSKWLVVELASDEIGKTPEATSKNLFFKYSTHPSMADRLAALPMEALDQKPVSMPAIGLLKDPDKVAEKLIAEIQKITAQEEIKDSKRLRKWTRNSTIHVNLRPLQGLGVFLILAGCFGGLIACLSAGWSLGLLLFLFGSISVGLLLFRFGRYRERLPLAVPDFSVLKSAWQNPPQFTDEQVKMIETELQARVAPLKIEKKKEFELASVSYDALSRCDYVRAHIAARLCLKSNQKSIEGAVGLAVAAAALGQFQQVQEALAYLHKTTGMADRSICWGAGWALLLCGDWLHAEAFLEKSAEKGLNTTTVSLLLALCRSNRGKLQGAVLLARQVCTPASTNAEHIKFLVDLLLRAGFLQEAQENLRRLDSRLDSDVEVLLLRVRINLLLKNTTAADQWTEQLKSRHPGADWFIRLGQFHEAARENAKASGLYNEALTKGFYPEGLLGLARIEAQTQNRGPAREHLIAALNTQRELGKKGVGPLPLFNQILSQLLALQEPVPSCRAWTATLNGGHSPPGLANKQLLIYASTREQADQSLQIVLQAMQPGVPPIPVSSIGWTAVRKERQPDGPVLAGVQGILN